MQQVFREGILGLGHRLFLSHLSRSNGSHRQREGTNLGAFVPVWLVLPRCEATNLGVFDLCHFDPLKRGCANSGGFRAR